MAVSVGLVRSVREKVHLRSPSPLGRVTCLFPWLDECVRQTLKVPQKGVVASQRHGKRKVCLFSHPVRVLPLPCSSVLHFKPHHFYKQLPHIFFE